MQNFHQSNVIFYRRGVLKSKYNRSFSRGLRIGDVGGGSRRTNQLGESLKPSIPLLHIQYRFTKVLVVRYSHVNCIHSTFAHLTKDFFRPIGILQPVDRIATLSFHDLAPSAEITRNSYREWLICHTRNTLHS